MLPCQPVASGALLLQLDSSPGCADDAGGLNTPSAIKWWAMVKLDAIIMRRLNSVLGSFVEEITPESVSVAMLRGQVTLENLTVRPSCFEALGLPVVLNVGKVGSLVLDIPMRALKSKPIRVTIRDVLVCVSPSPTTDPKKAQLEKHLFDWAKLEAGDGEIDPASRLGLILDKVLDNIAVELENVHIRFEDTLSCQNSWRCETHPDRCFSLGLTLDHLLLEGCLVSVGADGAATWKVGSVKGALRFLNKRITIGSAQDVRWQQQGQQMQGAAQDGGSSRVRGRRARYNNPTGLGLYLNHGERPLPHADRHEWAEEMRSYIAQRHVETGQSSDATLSIPTTSPPAHTPPPAHPFMYRLLS